MYDKERLTSTSLAYLACGTVVWAVIMVLSYIDKAYWLWNLFSYSIPLFLILECFIGLLLLYKRQFYALLTLSVLMLWAYKPITETFSVGKIINHTKTNPVKKLLKVFSFNVSTFNAHRNYIYAKQDSQLVDELCSYMAQETYKPDVLCFQEFHHDDWERTRVIEQLSNICNTKYYYMLPFWRNYQNGFFGLMIMSRYPIVNKGVLYSDGPYSLNKGIFVDLKIGEDTVKIVNVHLQSMSIRLEDSLSHMGLKSKIKSTFEKLKKGSLKGKFQVDTVERFIKESTYPIILCGDLNSFPYGYSYQKIKKYLKNSFEESGIGFGFTLNIAPYWVRLDNQFHSLYFKSLDTKVIRDIDNSDHFPIQCEYSF